MLSSSAFENKIPAKKIKLGKPGSIGGHLMQNGPGPIKVTRVSTSSKSAKKETEQEQPKSMYGLDMDLLKQLNIETDKKIKPEPKQPEMTMEQDFEELRKKFALDNNKAANRLRTRCFDYAVPGKDEESD